MDFNIDMSGVEAGNTFMVLTDTNNKNSSSYSWYMQVKSGTIIEVFFSFNNEYSAFII
jgi:hypothetical protein